MKDKIKIISGGQTGVDQIALQVAKELGIRTGGMMPKGWKTENGPMPELKELYGMNESLFSDYPHRTRVNILDADVTFLYGDISSPGAKLAITACRKYEKPYSYNPDAEKVRIAIKRGYRVFNIAGNRASRLTQQDLFDYEWIIKEAFENGTKQ